MTAVGSSVLLTEIAKTLRASRNWQNKRSDIPDHNEVTPAWEEA